MKDNVELKYVASKSEIFGPNYGYWELTINNDLLGQQVVTLGQEVALAVAVAISTAREVGRKEGAEKIKKRYKGIIDAYNNWQLPTSRETNRPWSDADKPMTWKSYWNLNDPRG